MIDKPKGVKQNFKKTQEGQKTEMNQKNQKDYPIEMKSDLGNANLILILENAQCAVMSAYQKEFPTVLYQYYVIQKDKVEKLVKLFKGNDLVPTKSSITFNQNQAKLTIKRIGLDLIQILPSKSKGLRPLLIQQKELDDDIKELNNQIKQLKQIGKNKDKQLKDLLNSKKQAQKQLQQANTLYKDKKIKFIGNDLELDERYSKYVKKDGNKHRLFMRGMQVNDDLIKEIVQFDLKKIQILSLGDNQITNYGFDLLFKDKGKKYWPVLFEIFLQNNKITKIHSLEEIQTLEKLALCQNELEEQTADYFCNHKWVEITEFRVSFKKGKNEESWKKLLPKLTTIFPKLKELWYSNEGDLGPITKKRILELCNTNHWALNHSLAGLQGLGGVLEALGGLGGIQGIGGGEGGNGLQGLVKLQLMSQLLKGAINK